MNIKSGDKVFVVKNREKSYYPVKQYEKLTVIISDLTDATTLVRNDLGLDWWIMTDHLSKSEPIKSRPISEILNS